MADAEATRAADFLRELGAQQHTVNVREQQLRGSASAYRARYNAVKALLPDERQGPDIYYPWPDQAGAEQAEGVDERER